MSEISAEERRRRRQERIKANAGDRLAKITAGNKGRTPDPVVIPSSEPQDFPQTTPDTSAPQSTGASSSFSATPASVRVLPNQQPIVQPLSALSELSNNNKQPPTDLNDTTPSSDSAGSVDNDPLFQLLSKLNSSTSSGSPKPQDFNDFASQFASMMGMSVPTSSNGSGFSEPPSTPFPFGAQQQQQPPPPVTPEPSPKSSRTDLLWTALHFVVFSVLAITSGLVFSQRRQFTELDIVRINEYYDPSFEYLAPPADNALDSASEAPPNLIPPKLLWYFSTLELVLQTSRFFIERGAPPADSKLTKFASYLPHPFNTYLYTGARYARMVKTIVQDFCLLLFIGGIYSLISS
ncbi:uncharacterized protein SAPINGB_P002752 [Magnusiomyces paraingens]|uniref:GET complex subunit GET2 n=1 Tax=Magnusiomyces paraingens TaxID=2606893 RepID=A0A5E8BFK3_9ASCO|nr:uncharacterized protein SAPINGB_P002752 [Saprochaete ingens]VVT50416.1 unnamed protein product [Saprochaete ingens]